MENIIDNIFVFCETDKNCYSIAAFFNRFRLKGDNIFTSADFNKGFYYGLHNGEFTKYTPVKTIDIVSNSTNCFMFGSTDEAYEFIEQSVRQQTPIFPKIMWVKQGAFDYIKRIVIAFIDNKYIALNYESFETMNKSSHYDKYNTHTYDYALDLNNYRVVTKQEIADILNIDVNNLKIIE